MPKIRVKQSKTLMAAPLLTPINFLNHDRQPIDSNNVPFLSAVPEQMLPMFHNVVNKDAMSIQTHPTVKALNTKPSQRSMLAPSDIISQEPYKNHAETSLPSLKIPQIASKAGRKQSSGTKLNDSQQSYFKLDYDPDVDSERMES